MRFGGSWFGSRRPVAPSRCPRSALRVAPTLAPATPRAVVRFGSRREDRLGGALHALHAMRRELAAVQAQLRESRAQEARARTLAAIDVLTPLENRRAFLQRLQSALTARPGQPKSLAVLYIDLDEFKAVNDRHGHHVGDELLRIVADRLSSCVRASDAVGRFGGDEFVCLVHGEATRERISHIACKLFDALSEPYQLGALRLSVRASIGIALAPTDATTAQGLLERADAAMYRAKRAHLGYAFVSPERDGDATKDTREGCTSFRTGAEGRVRR